MFPVPLDFINPFPDPTQKYSTIEPGYDYIGEDFRNFFTPNSTVCKNQCLQSDICKSWTFLGNDATNNCFLKTGLGNRVPRNYTTSGRILANNNYFPRLSSFDQGIACDGENFIYSYYPNANICQNACILNDQCQQWTYTPANNKCQLKRNIYHCTPRKHNISGNIFETRYIETNDFTRDSMANIDDDNEFY